MNNKISIVIPAYNIENYLADTLESLISQTYKNIEIIIVNDGSKDGTSNIIDEYASKYEFIKGIHKENGGVTSARIAGIEAATGEWIGFVDGDDFAEPDMFQRLMDNALKHNADISHCGYQMVFPNGRIDYYYNSKKLVVQNNVDGLRDIVSGSVYEPALWNKIYKASLFEDLLKNDLMDKTIKNTEDLLMNYYLFKKAKSSVFEDFCPYHYVLRQNSAATSKINEHKLLDPKKVIKIIHDDISDDLKPLLFGRYIVQLINLSSMKIFKETAWIKPYRRSARKELRQSLKKVLASPISPKVKVMTLWTAVWPWSYQFIHTIHGRIKGSAHKYDIE
ncbi:MAG: glycosyltransferase [Ruminococcaceae bacterium]|nr:glycosyltransferase [Oscillospiraceae bacterium]